MGGGEVASRTQSGTIHKPVSITIMGLGVQESTSPWAPCQAPACGKSQSLKIIPQIFLLPSLIWSQDSKGGSSAIKARAQAKWGFLGNVHHDILNFFSPIQITSLPIPNLPRDLFKNF